MTTASSRKRVLRRQAKQIVAVLKLAERRDPRAPAKMLEARDRESVKAAVAMDDKIIILEVPWKTIAETSDIELQDFIVEQMQKPAP